MSLMTEKEINKHCFLSTSFQNAKKLVQQEKVNSILIKKTGSSCLLLEGDVEGVSKDAYRLQVDFEFTEMKNGNHKGKPVKYRCECEAYQTYGGFCKHIAAAILMANRFLGDNILKDILLNCAVGYQVTYRREDLSGERNDSYSPAASREEPVYEPFSDEVDRIFDPEVRRRSFMYHPLMNVLELHENNEGHDWLSYSDFPYEDFLDTGLTSQKTSAKLLDLMSGIVLKQRSRFCRNSGSGNVRLEPFLNLDYEGVPRLEFKIGNVQMYVIKNVSGFLKSFKQQEKVRFGKNLTLVLTPGAFTQDSFSAISMILDSGLEVRGEKYQNADERRFLKLTPAMVDHFLLPLAGKEVKVSGRLAKGTSELMVKKGYPRFKVFIDSVADGRRAVITFPEMMYFEGIKRIYIIDNDSLYICDEDYYDDMHDVLKLLGRSGNWYKGFDYRQAEKRSTLELMERDFTFFQSTLLPVLEKYMDVEIQDLNFDDYRPEEGKFEVYLETEDNCILCDAKAIYGNNEHNLIDIASISETYRDIQTEFELRQLLEEFFPAKTEDGRRYRLENDDERLAALVEYGIGQIREIAELFVSEEFKKIRMKDSVRLNAGLSIKGNLLEVSWQIDGLTNDEVYEIIHSYQKKKKYYRLHSGELLNIEESGLNVLADLNENLRLNKHQLMDGKATVSFYRSVYLDLLAKENRESMQTVRNQQFEQMIRNFETAKNAGYEVPSMVKAELRPYQVDGYRFIRTLAELGFGGILADDMGLGKTLQMITYLCCVTDRPHLVVCPTSLIYNWEAELNKYAPDLTVCVVTGTARQREELIRECGWFNVVVTSYDMLKRDVAHYEKMEFGCEILDEAQYIKNPVTQVAKSVKIIKSRNRFALTGTPVENRLSELWSIFDYLMPGYLYQHRYFKEYFEEKIMLDDGSDEYQKTVGRLQKMIQPFVLRRLKKDVLKELPDKVEKIVYAKFGEEQQRLYQASEKNILMNIGRQSKKEFGQNKIQILAEITKLRQICCDPSLIYRDYHGDSAKLDSCVEIVESAIDGGHRILLFSQFSSMLKILEERIKKCGIRTFLMTGSTSKVKRKHLVERFQQGEAEVFLISLKAGGTGLNLTGADMVIHFDPWWNLAAQDQATDRAHRIGQKNVVTVIKMIGKNTIEERIMKLQEKKKELADKIISGENVSMASLTQEELLELFTEPDKMSTSSSQSPD